MSTFVDSFTNFYHRVSGQRQVSVGRVVVFKTLLKPQIISSYRVRSGLRLCDFHQKEKNGVYLSTLGNQEHLCQLFCQLLSSRGVSGQRQVSVSRVVVFITLLKPQTREQKFKKFKNLYLYLSLHCAAQGYICTSILKI